MYHYSRPLKQTNRLKWIRASAGLLPPPPTPEKVRDRTISYNPEKAAYMELGSLSFWILGFLLPGLIGRAQVLELSYLNRP